jgi:hypothetical protein
MSQIHNEYRVDLEYSEFIGGLRVGVRVCWWLEGLNNGHSRHVSGSWNDTQWSYSYIDAIISNAEKQLYPNLSST